MVTSYVGGDYNFDKTNVETNIYESALKPIAEPVVEPVIEPVVEPEPISVVTPVVGPIAETIDDATTVENTNLITLNSSDFNYNNDNDKTRFGSEVNTQFQKQFNIRGFAAGMDIEAGSAEESSVSKKIIDVSSIYIL